MTTESQYKIEEIVLTSERWGAREFDISKAVVELNIYEDIEKPYLTGNLLYVDNLQFKSFAGITGTERVKITIVKLDNTSLVKRFIISSVQKEVSANERTDVRALQLVEEHAFLSSLKKFSKAYRGYPSFIISSILSGHLNKSVDMRNVGHEQEIKVVIPYRTPLDAVEWIRDNMATATGCPYFLHASLMSDNLQLTTLENLIGQRAWNDKIPYTYGLGFHSPTGQAAPGKVAQKEMFNIERVSAVKIENTLQLAMSGAVGVEMNTLDVTLGRHSHSGHINSKNTVSQILEKKVSSFKRGESSTLNYYSDMEIGVDNLHYKKLHDYPSKVFSRVTADVYDDVNSYSYERDDANRYQLPLKAAQLRRVIMNNVYNVQVPGPPFLLVDGAGVGGSVMINYALNTIDSTQNKKVDPERSGKFVTYRTRHQFVEERHTVTMSVVKMTRTSS
jgi:hypothetical protein